jgi:hypothetical protein
MSAERNKAEEQRIIFKMNKGNWGIVTHPITAVWERHAAYLRS